MDHYFHTGPITDPRDFVGRREQVQEVFERLNKAASTSLVGERHSGKTSVLHYLMTDAAQQAFSFDARGFVFVGLDARNGIQDPPSYYSALMGALASQVPEAAPAVGREVRERHVKAALNRLAPRRLVLLLDEFELIACSDRFPIDFFRYQRGFTMEHEVCFVLATRKILDRCCPADMVASQFPNIFATQYLGAFSEVDCDAFLYAASQRCDAPLAAHKTELLDLAGRLPFFLQLASSLYVDVWRERGAISPEDTPGIKLRLAEILKPHFDAIWETALDGSEKGTLAALVRGQEVADSVALRSLTLKGYLVDGHRLPSVLSDLVGRKQLAP
jgi:hypothetical protein